MATVPNSAPANPYQTMAGMQPPTSPTSPTSPPAGAPQNSIAEAYRLIVETMAKMEKLAPEMGPELEAAAQSLKAGVVKVTSKGNPTAPPEHQPAPPPPQTGGKA